MDNEKTIPKTQFINSLCVVPQFVRINKRRHRDLDQVNQFLVHELKIIGHIEHMDRFDFYLAPEISTQAR